MTRSQERAKHRSLVMTTVTDRACLRRTSAQLRAHSQTDGAAEVAAPTQTSLGTSYRRSESLAANPDRSVLSVI